MADNMFLYWGSGSPPCWCVMIALEEKGLSNYKQKLLSFDKKEHKSEEILKLNPRGQLPTFKDGDIVINESMAILHYLESKFKDKKLLPEDTKEMACALQRMNEASNINSALLEKIVAYKWFSKPEDVHQSVLDERYQAARVELGYWEKYLEQMQEKGCSFISGKSFSLADAIVFSLLAVAVRFGLMIEKFPCLAAYYKKLVDRPSIQKTWPPHWKESPPNEKMGRFLSDI